MFWPISCKNQKGLQIGLRFKLEYEQYNDRLDYLLEDNRQIFLSLRFCITISRKLIYDILRLVDLKQPFS